MTPPRGALPRVRVIIPVRNPPVTPQQALVSGPSFHGLGTAQQPIAFDDEDEDEKHFQRATALLASGPSFHGPGTAQQPIAFDNEDEDGKHFQRATALLASGPSFHGPGTAQQPIAFDNEDEDGKPFQRATPQQAAASRATSYRIGTAQQPIDLDNNDEEDYRGANGYRRPAYVAPENEYNLRQLARNPLGVVIAVVRRSDDDVLTVPARYAVQASLDSRGRMYRRVLNVDLDGNPLPPFGRITGELNGSGVGIFASMTTAQIRLYLETLAEPGAATGRSGYGGRPVAGRRTEGEVSEK